MTPEDYAHLYHANGYIIIDDLIAPELLIRLKTAIESIQQHADDVEDSLKALLTFEHSLGSEQRGGTFVSATDSAIFLIGDPPLFDPMFKELIYQRGIYELCAALLDTRPLLYHFMNVTIKHPHWGRSVSMHRDFPNAYMCPATPAFMRLILCLDGMCAENGGMFIVPDSHISPQHHAVQSTEAISCRAGSMVALHPLLLHGSTINRSTEPRRNIILQIGAANAPLITAAQESLTGTLIEGNV